MSYQLGMDPVKSLKWVDEAMESYYPLGVFKDIDGVQ